MRDSKLFAAKIYTFFQHALIFVLILHTKWNLYIFDTAIPFSLFLHFSAIERFPPGRLNKTHIPNQLKTAKMYSL